MIVSTSKHPTKGQGHLRRPPRREPVTLTLALLTLSVSALLPTLASLPRRARRRGGTAHAPAQPSRHCFNYLRQTLACRGDLQMDAYQYAHKVHALHPHAVRRCRDWRPVYEKVWENQREYHAWLNETQTEIE